MPRLHRHRHHTKMYHLLLPHLLVQPESYRYFISRRTAIELPRPSFLQRIRLAHYRKCRSLRVLRLRSLLLPVLQDQHQLLVVEKSRVIATMPSVAVGESGSSRCNVDSIYVSGTPYCITCSIRLLALYMRLCMSHLRVFWRPTSAPTLAVNPRRCSCIRRRQDA